MEIPNVIERDSPVKPDTKPSANPIRRPLVLVTGSKGRLAQAALPELERHFDIRATDKAPGSPGEPNYFPADITQFSQVKPLCQGVEAVVHLAIASLREFGVPTAPDTEVDPDRVEAFEETTIRVNVDGTRHIFEAARLAGVKKIVYLSSMTAYQGNKEIPRYERHTPFNPLNLYACTKIFGENLAHVYARDHGISIIVLRLGQPYPSGTHLDHVWQSNRRARSLFVTLEDTVQAVLCGLNAKGVDFGIYNIVSASDNPRVDLSPAREIGYIPRACFSETGLSNREDMPPLSA